MKATYVQAQGAAGTRLHFISSSFLLCCALAALPASAQQYPVKPVRLVVPSSAGGGTDIVARILVPEFAKRLGQQVVVDNRPGAGTMIGIDHVAKSAPDGYTLLMGLSTLAINSALNKNVPYDPIGDFAPITVAVTSASILVVHPSVPVKTLKDFIAFARARPGQLNYASAGAGTYPHMTYELFLSMAKLKMVHIPYKGTAPAMVDMVAGQVASMAATVLTGLPHIRSGRLRPLGITSAKRNPTVPDIPTVAEAGLPGFESVQWYAVLAPAKTPKSIISKVHSDLVAVLNMPSIKKRFAGDAAETVGNTPEEFARHLKSELDKWEKVARGAGIEKR